MFDARRIRNWLRRGGSSSARNYKISHRPQLLIDVSILNQKDAGTGIQRVVRAICEQLLRSAIENYDVKLVAATRRAGYRYVDFGHSDRIAGAPLLQFVTAAKGDVFLGLDLCSRILPRHKRTIRSWRRKGVKISIVVYDLLPATNPEWFNEKQTAHFVSWLRFVNTHADQALCISQTVALELDRWLKTASVDRRLPSIRSFPLAGDLGKTVPTFGISDAEAVALQSLANQKFILMVGTIEPRKGHMVALDAYDKMLKTASDSAPALVIVGRTGWNSEHVEERIRNHHQINLKLFWFENASDELLSKLYQRCIGLFFPTFGEGFGLPLVEAISFNKPILARDLPVFREISSPLVSYFENDSDVELARSIGYWLQHETDRDVSHTVLETWSKSSEILMHHLSEI